MNIFFLEIHCWGAVLSMTVMNRNGGVGCFHGSLHLFALLKDLGVLAFHCPGYVYRIYRDLQPITGIIAALQGWWLFPRIRGFGENV